MFFALYKNSPAFISSLIRWQTRSVYSHVAIGFSPTLVYEALSQGFVKSPGIGAAHEPGTLVDILEYIEPLSPLEETRARKTCESMVGAKYDFEMVLAGFPFRYTFEPTRSRDKKFCSEAAFLAAAAMGERRTLLARIQPWEVSPEHINLSPLLKWVKTINL